MSATSGNSVRGFQQYPPLTFRDHCLNVLRLVVKELRSIRADPTMLALVIYAFTISVNTVATGAVTEATNLVGRHRRRGRLFELSRQIADGAAAADLPDAGADPGDEIDEKMDHGELLFVVEIPPNFEADLRAKRKTGIQINIDATAISQAGNGANYLRSAISRRDPAVPVRQDRGTGLADQSRRARRIQSEPQNLVVLGDDAGHQPDHAADGHPHRRGADPRARAGHGRASARHAARSDRDHAGENVRQRARHPGSGDVLAAVRRALVDRLADRRLAAGCSSSAPRFIRWSSRRSAFCSARWRPPWASSACSPCPC